MKNVTPDIDHMIVLLLGHLLFSAVLLGCHPDLFRKVPILPEEYGPLSLVNGMMYWEAQIPHRIFDNHRIHSCNLWNTFNVFRFCRDDGKGG